jgi:hypothetical protein
VPKVAALKAPGRKKKQAEKGMVFKACQVLKQKHAASTRLSSPLSGSMPEHFSRTETGHQARVPRAGWHGEAGVHWSLRLPWRHH